MTVPLALRGAQPARKQPPKASGGVPPAHSMLSQTCRAPLARRVPYRFVNAPLDPSWRTTVSLARHPNQAGFPLASNLRHPLC